MEANRGLAHGFAAHLARVRPDVCAAVGGLDDLVQLALVGLLRAAELFDPGRGVRFSTFATYWIRQSISRAHAGADPIRVPCYISGELRAELRRRLRPSSLDALDGDVTLAAVGPDVELFDLREEVAAAVKELPPRLRRIVRRRFFQGWTLQRVGDAEGVSRERIRQLQEEALARLRELLGAAAVG